MACSQMASICPHNKAGERSWEVPWGDQDAPFLPSHSPQYTVISSLGVTVLASSPQALVNDPSSGQQGVHPLLGDGGHQAPPEPWCLLLAGGARDQTPAHRGEQEWKAISPGPRDRVRLEPVCVWATCFHPPCPRQLSKGGPPGAGLHLCPPSPCLTGLPDLPWLPTGCSAPDCPGQGVTKH